MSESTLDCRGVPITPGCVVVTSGTVTGRLYEKRVKMLEHRPPPSWWVNVRFTDGSCTTPDCVAVVEPAS